MLLNQGRTRKKANVFTLSYTPPMPEVTIEAATAGFSNIMSYLDGKSRGNCRLTCQIWKQVLDEEIGLCLKLNEKKYKKDNATFCRRVVIERLTVEHLDKFSKYLTLRCPEKLLMIHCLGPVSSDWFKQKLLGQCTNLRRLELTGRFLQSQELTCRIGNNANIDQSNHPYQDDTETTNATMKHYLTFAHLKSLIIFYTEADVKGYLQHVNGTGPLQSIWGTVFGTRFQAIYLLKQMIDANVSYILATIRSPVLRTLYVSVDSMSIEEKTQSPALAMWTYKWKIEPLRAFLDYHRTSLRQLYLPYYNGVTRDEKKVIPVLPCALNSLEVTILQKGDRKHTTYIEKLLLGQTELRELRFQKDYVGQALTEFPSLGSVIRNSENTLTFLHLTLSAPEREFLDGLTFTKCDVLKTMIVKSQNDRLHFRNVTSLPKSLTHLSIVGPTLILLPGEYLEFPNLELLILHDVLIHSNDDSKRIDMIRLIEKILRMRRLSRLFLDTREAECENECCVIVNSMIHTLLGDSRYSAPNPFSNLEIHDAKWSLNYRPHFLESSPFGRLVVDPTKSSRVLSTMEEMRESPLERVVIRSNIFQSVPLNQNQLGSRGVEERSKEEDVPWCDFCYALFTFD